MISQIGNVKLNYSHYSGQDLYSDGKIEDVLLDIVRNNPSSNYNSIIAEYKSWPVLYHLSHLRENIINWIPISREETVLEIGSGCGAITGCLAGCAKNVTCIELSEKRSLINAYRNSNRENIEIFLGNFEDIEKSLTKKYDYITLIGVFEYSEKYISNKNSYVSFLQIIKKHLAPGGKIILAIENKLGMKYWSGCKEDHLGEYFEGIEGYCNSKGIKTFSKNELIKVIKQAGFEKYIFYYPYPDYKFPEVIYSDNYLPKIGELNNNIVNYDQERIVLFDETRAFNSVMKAGLFPEFCNSFLLIIE